MADNFIDGPTGRRHQMDLCDRLYEQWRSFGALPPDAIEMLLAAYFDYKVVAVFNGETTRSWARILEGINDHENEILAKSRQRQPIRPSLRFDVLREAGYRCNYCGTSAAEVQLHVDHVLPVSQGGTNERSNLVAACAPCNLGRKAGPINARGEE